MKQQSAMRLVTLCGSTPSKFDAIRDSQDILEARFAEAGLSVHPVDLGAWSLPTVPAILREISRRKPDVILMQYPSRAFGVSLGPVAIAGIQRIAPLVVMLHEFVAAHPLRKAAVGALLARADRIGVTADRERERLGRWFPWVRGRLRNIPIASNIPGRAWTPSMPPRVVYFGQMRPRKGLEEFFECHARIVSEMPHVRFGIIGAPVPKFADYGAMIQDRARACGMSILPSGESSDVADSLSQATLALLPFPDGASFRRGSLFAAAGCGVPLVTTTGDDTPDQLLPFLEPARTVSELTALALRYLSDGQSLSDAHDRSVRLSALFGWDRTVERYIEVFSEVFANRPGPLQTVRAPRMAAGRVPMTSDSKP
jgi:glycosyltransferase involved in cell wall biosynthesis